MQTEGIDEVYNFWDKNPLFAGENSYEIGTREFFEEHRRVVIEDCNAGSFKEDYIPSDLSHAKVLDLGCGIGFWTIEIQLRRKCSEFYSADLTSKAIEITDKRLQVYGLTSNLSIQNAEKMNYSDGFFDHVNCQGVIHHTPDTETAVKEISRVLRQNGTASISVYYKNFFLRNWQKLSFFGKIASLFGSKLKGRGRENIYSQNNTDEIVRLYDGRDNPIGKAYSKREIFKMVEPYFEVEKIFLIFFPARTLPIPMPKFFHRFLEKHFGFMIHLNLKKK
jgi:ubiquinone/menaquinone biosynthesis C-methylase UbiE